METCRVCVGYANTLATNTSITPLIRIECLHAYLVNDIRLQYSVKTKLFKEIVWSAWVRNFTNTQYVSNAWIYKFKSAYYNPVPDDAFANKESVVGRYNLIGAFPQAGINFFTGLILKF